MVDTLALASVEAFVASDFELSQEVGHVCGYLQRRTVLVISSPSSVIVLTVLV
ncbi:hypothetical protein [Rhizobium sp. BK068]|uniref:hypothetical protein n=1 Tax=Rhizobium sp. BK068 TaxID=2512130 RepID=UPI0014054AE6|nr:hypothetical protein [Rhizobium sp. BK068]